jgi:hypothetical protein
MAMTRVKIARLTPVRAVTPAVQLVPATRDFAPLRDRRCRPARWKISSLELLLEERSGR